MPEADLYVLTGTLANGGLTFSPVSVANPLPTTFAGTITVGGIVLSPGTNSIGTVGLNAGTNSIGSVLLAAGTNALGTVALTGTSAVSGTVGLSGGTIDAILQVGTANVSTANPVPTIFATTSASAAGITAVTTLTTLESGHVAKAGAGNLYDCYVTNTGTAAGYLFVMNSTTVPANGTLGSGIIVECIAVGTIASGGISYNGGPPTVFSTGISLAFSSTAAPVLTLVANGFFNARVA
jgi:hypothetical protein